MRPLPWIVLAVLLTTPVLAQATPDSVAIAGLERYMGSWLTTQPTDGTSPRFSYHLMWFDSRRTVAKMRIGLVRAEGESPLWEGFKGWDTIRRVSFYYGFDTGGRQAIGTVHLAGDSTITSYQGLAPNGQTVDVRDVSYFLTPDTWRGITYIRPSGDTPWREVRRDNFQRVP